MKKEKVIKGKYLNFNVTPVTTQQPKLEEGAFSTDPSWWSVKEIEGKYIFSCLSGRLQGGEMVIEVTEEEYKKLVSGTLTATDICFAYNIG